MNRRNLLGSIAGALAYASVWGYLSAWRALEEEPPNKVTITVHGLGPGDTVYASGIMNMGDWEYWPQPIEGEVYDALKGGSVTNPG